jgi:hypothetical protein
MTFEEFWKSNCDRYEKLFHMTFGSRANHNREFWQKHHEGLMEKEV